jgi:hypothetical protein
LTGYVQLRAVRVEVEVLHFDQEVQMDSGGGCRACVLDCCDASDCAGAEEITGADQVVCVPLEGGIV